MKKFIIQVLATIVGIVLLTSIVVFGLILINIIAFIPSKFVVKDKSILEINLNNPILESPNDKEASISLLNNDKRVYLKDILQVINQAKTDEKIEGISLKLSNINSGYSQIAEIRQALLNFKESKKFIYSYSNDCDQRSYYLSSVADSLYVNPNASIELAGLSAEVLFYKNLGQKFGVNFEVLRHGKYKSAVEPYLRDNLSEENRYQLKNLLENFWYKISSDIISSRKITNESFNKSVDSLYGFIPELAYTNNLVDRLIYESQYDNLIKKRLSLSDEDSINKISLEQYKEIIEDVSFINDKIAILYASGQIYTGKGDSEIYSKTFINLINEIKNDDDIKAVVLRVNSPGGSANASAEILYELYELKKKKPLIVSFSDIAASGGYYISMAADKIYAQDNTLTGSIGVLGMIPDVKKLANTIGITSDYVSTNANSNYYSITQGTSQGFKGIMNKGITITYNKFINEVMKGRHMTYAQVDSVGQGRIWSGRDALEKGLVDEIGGFNEAVEYAAKKAGVTSYNLVSYPEEKNKWDLIVNMFTSDANELNQSGVIDNLIKYELGKDHYKLYQKIKNIESNQGIMYLMPYDVKIK
ncbi:MULTISPECIES: signal peptide peptidase SppA [Apibacter]|uniref:signal peptide peptidase SppA n=1 Tax=Apibacter TaxID=1778601 RepID=UPI001C6966EB|nr:MULTISPECIES: signal peptide peptidase SppA [Apibacter]QYN51340.1 signal peptide peptidase SppA [Apibacter sp. ESL0404]